MCTNTWSQYLSNTSSTRESRKRTYKPPVIVETQELLRHLTVPNGCGPDGEARRVWNFTVDLPGALQLPERDLPLHPYVLGVWLGDGHVMQHRADGGDVELSVGEGCACAVLGF